MYLRGRWGCEVQEGTALLTLDQKVIFLEADCHVLFNLTGLFNRNG